jgi:alpha-methylacyl-CoA racemase
LLAFQPGPPDRPVVPPALIADIAGGSFPAVINILLALRQRDLTGEGCHLDIAMTDAMFTFAWRALSGYWASGSLAGVRTERTDRCHAALSPVSGKGRRDRRLRRAGEPFLATLRRHHRAAGPLADDQRDPDATMTAVAGIILSRSAAEWEPIFANADCCVTIVRTLDEALRDPHFIARGLFAHRVRGGQGATLTALPVPIDPQFRDQTRQREGFAAAGVTRETAANAVIRFAEKRAIL